MPAADRTAVAGRMQKVTMPDVGELARHTAARRWPELLATSIRGRAGGQVVWQPRIAAWWKDKRFFGEPLPEPYEHLSVPDMFRYLDCSARLYEFNECFRRVEHPAVKVTTHDLGNNQTLTSIRTPAGEQTAIKEARPTCRLAMQVKREIVTQEDLRVATWRAENADYVFDREVYDRLLAEWGDLGLPSMYLPRVNIQDLYINTMGIQQAILALHEWGPEAFAPYFRALDELHERFISLLNTLPQFEIVNFGDNLHASTLPPRWFEKYVLPAYIRRCELLHRAGKFVHAHWDGDTRSLLRFAQQTPLDGIEAITPRPQGDVTLEEVREALGDRLFLIDGIPAIYFDTTYEPAELEACAAKVIELFAPRLILGISDEISSTGDIERVRLVGRIVDEHNAASARDRQAMVAAQNEAFAGIPERMAQ